MVLDMNYAVYWHLPPLFNPANFLGEHENIFPGIVSANILCIPGEMKMEMPQMRRVMTAADTWRT